jgi:leucine-rich repeat protein SHOC2
MKFTKLGDAVLKPLDVTVLDLAGWVTTADLLQFPNLILLRIEDGNLELSDKVKLPNLEDLLLVNRSNARFKGISFLPLAFPNLLSLHLEYVFNSEEIGENISEFKRLQKLIINQGQLSNLSFIGRVPKTLNYLDIGANYLTEIPAAIGKLKNLERLNAPSNLIEVISPKLTNLKKLRNLVLGNNQISNLPRMNKFSNLFTIELSNNAFRTFPKSLTKCPQLHEIYISNNSFQKFPPDICNMPRLRQLGAHSCQIKSLPRNFGRLQSLRKLGLGENLFQSFPSSICEISNLEWLNFDNNQLKKLPNSIKKLSALRRLELAGNGLKDLPLAFGDLTKLFEVNLERNNFKELPRILMTFPKTNFIGIAGRRFLNAYRASCKGILLKSPKTHLVAYDFISNKTKKPVSSSILSELTRITIPTIQRKAQGRLVEKLREGGEMPQLKEIMNIAFIGKNSIDYQHFMTEDLTSTDDFEQAELWIVGNDIRKTQIADLEKNKQKLLTEKEFLSQLLHLKTPYLLLPENQDFAQNLSELFKAKEDENKIIAISAMTTGGIPQNLKIELICQVVTWQNDFINSSHATELCQLHLTSKELDIAEYFWGFWLNRYSVPVSQSMNQLKSLCESANFNYEDFYAYYVGWKKKAKLPV